MKFNLLAASILVAGAMAAEKTAFDIKKVNATIVRDVLAGGEEANAAKAELAANFSSLKSEYFNLAKVDHLAELLREVKRVAKEPFALFEKVPLKFFKSEVDIKKLMASTTADINEFVALITADQFAEVVKLAAEFPQLSTASLANIEAALKESKKISNLKNFAKHITIDYLNIILNPTVAVKGEEVGESRKVSALGKDILKNLSPSVSESLLNKIVFPLAEEDGAFLTDVQLKNLKESYKCKELNLAKVSAKKFAENITNEKVLQRLAKEKKISKEQFNKLPAESWSKIFAGKDVCEKILPEVKIQDISAVKINAKCFAKLNADLQSTIVATHKKLDADILSRVTKEMTKDWTYKSASGLEILQFTEKKAIIKQLGIHENIDSSSHPAFEMSIESVKENKALYDNLDAQTIAAMTIEFPTELKEFKKNAEFYCGKEGVVAAIEELFEEKVEKKKEKEEEKKEGEAKAVIADNFWSTLSKEEAAKFFGPSYSVMTAEMSKESFMKLAANAAAIAEVSSAALIQLKFFNELPKEVYAKLNEKAFAAVSAEHVESFRLADATDAQVPHISTQAKESFFAKVPAAVLAKNESRFGLFTSEQVAALPVATFKVAVNKTTMPKIKAEATKKITAEQLKAVSTEVFATITAEQVTMMGADIADEMASALSVLLANQASLNTEARAALFARVPGSSASRFGVSAAVAAFAALALLA